MQACWRKKPSKLPDSSWIRKHEIWGLWCSFSSNLAWSALDHWLHLPISLQRTGKSNHLHDNERGEKCEALPRSFGTSRTYRCMIMRSMTQSFLQSTCECPKYIAHFCVHELQEVLQKLRKSKNNDKSRRSNYVWLVQIVFSCWEAC